MLKEKPLDFHMGVSLQQLVQTNSLLYSTISQIYYEDKNAFNNTFLFSELGMDYTFKLNKKIAIAVGPRVSYSHTGAIKGSKDHHLFSYGLSTQLFFTGK